MEIPISAKLKAVRALAGLSQKNLEARSGVAVNIISAIEKGRVLPTSDDLQRIGAALGLNFNSPDVEAAFMVLSGHRDSLAA